MALHGIGIWHQDIQPANIKVSETGEIAIIDFHCMDPMTSSGYKRMVSNYTYASPISPQLVKPFISKSLDVQYSLEKNDVWSIGITMVCAATVSSFKDFYDLTYGNILMDKINERLSMMEHMGCSSYFVRCMANMLNPNEDYRPSLKDLLNFLNQPQPPVTARQGPGGSPQQGSPRATGY